MRRRSRGRCGSCRVPTSPRGWWCSGRSSGHSGKLGHACRVCGIRRRHWAGPCKDRRRERCHHPFGGLCLVTGSLWLVGAFRAPTAARVVTLRATELASLDAWALWRAQWGAWRASCGAVCGVRLATWCVRGVVRTVWCVGSADRKRVRSGGGRRGRPWRCRSVDRGAELRTRRGRSGRRCCRRRLGATNRKLRPRSGAV